MNNHLKTFVVRRRSAWKTSDELQAATGRSATVGDHHMPTDVRWIRTYVVSEPDGRLGSVCIYQASSREKLHEHAARVGMPADVIHEITDTVIVRPDPAPLAV